MKRMDGRIALISGGASGIGAAAARRFVEEGARVMLGDIQSEKGQAFASELGDAARYVDLDVREPAAWEAAVEATRGAFGGIDCIVNSAGVSIPGTIEQIDLASFRHTLAINLDGTFNGCKAGVAALKESGGTIVNVASTLGHKGVGMFVAYNSSKGGVRLLSKSVAMHCAGEGYPIRVNTLIPGAIHTEMVEGYVEAGKAQGVTREQVIGDFAQMHPMKRLGTPKEAADGILFLASHESSFTTGGELAVDGGFLA